LDEAATGWGRFHLANISCPDRIRLYTVKPEGGGIVGNLGEATFVLLPNELPRT
jgi:hypothetical protein